MNSIYKSATDQATMQAPYESLLSQLPAEIEQPIRQSAKRNAPSALSWFADFMTLASPFQ